MVFISLEDVVGAAGNCSVKHSVQSKPTTHVVVTPGSPAKQQNTRMARTGLFHLTSTQPTLSSTEYFVLYVSDSVMRQKWVISKTSTDQAQLRMTIRRVGSGCKESACCGQLHRVVKTSNISTRRLWRSTSQYDQCSAFQAYLNDLVHSVLSRDAQCQSKQRVRRALEDFLEIGHHRVNAIDRVLYHENPAVSPPATTALKPCQAGEDCSDMSDDSSECPICCSDLADDQTLRLPCSHNYHAGCVRVWLNLQHTCPVCRLQLDTIE